MQSSFVLAKYSTRLGRYVSPLVGIPSKQTCFMIASKKALFGFQSNKQVLNIKVHCATITLCMISIS